MSHQDGEYGKEILSRKKEGEPRLKKARETREEILRLKEEEMLRLNGVREPLEAILRFRRVHARTGIPRSTLYDMMRDGRFPRPISLGGGRTVGWLSSEVDQWIADQAEASRRTA